MMDSNKNIVKEFWNEASCGENLFLKGENEKQKYVNQSAKRYELEPYIIGFANFENNRDKKVLEVGVGLGSDHQKFAENGCDLTGCDLTERAIEYTKERLKLFDLKSNLSVADAEALPFPDSSFDLVYSWGVIHHTPNTKKAASEIYRVLKNGGEARIMIYQKYSMVGFMLWLRYALLALKPFRTLNYVYSNYLESPGTKAYSLTEAKLLFEGFSKIEMEVELSHGDLLSSFAGQRHQGFLLNLARRIYPRKFIQRFFPHFGLFLLIKLTK